MLARRNFRRRSLSMTSLIDVIFLLLLFFMLSSTFARHGELSFSAGTGGRVSSDETPIFIRLGDGALSLNGTEISPEDIPAALRGLAPEGGPIILSLTGEANAQALVDVLAVLRLVPNVDVMVID